MTTASKPPIPEADLIEDSELDQVSGGMSIGTSAKLGLGASKVSSGQQTSSTGTPGSGGSAGAQINTTIRN